VSHTDDSPRPRSIGPVLLSLLCYGSLVAVAAVAIAALVYIGVALERAT
jgi:hypothetical protein